MKAGVFYGAGDIRFEEVEDLALTGDQFDVLVKVEAVGICGSDLHRYNGHSVLPLAQPIGGHEISGTVVEIGPNVTNVAVGDRVGVEPVISCGECRFCRIGEYQVCSNSTNIGSRHSGGFAQYTKAPHKKVFRLPEHISFEEACTLDCYTVAVHALRRVPVTMGDTVVVIGAGAIGITTAQVVQAAGASRVVIVDVLDNILEVAKKCGIPLTFNSAKGDLKEYIMDLTGGIGADVVFEAVGGKAPTLQQAAQIVRPLGAIGHLGSRSSIEMSIMDAYGKEATITFLYAYSTWGPRPEFEVALQLMADRRIDAASIITHRLALKDIKTGFDAMADKAASGAVKVILSPNK